MVLSDPSILVLITQVWLPKGAYIWVSTKLIMGY